MFVPEDKVNLFESLEGYNCEVFNKQDYDEYVYDTSELKELKGKKLKSKKNQLNRYFRDCNACEFTKLEKEDMEDCLKLTEDWCIERGIEKEDLHSSDYIPIKIIFDNFDKLDVRGGAIRLHKKLIAFCIGSNTIADTAFVHFEKVDHVITGASVAIIVATINEIFPDAKFINREEDMGIDGIRNAKQSYNPVYMTQKNDIFLTKK